MRRIHESDDDKKRRRRWGRLEPCWICKVYVQCLVAFAVYRILLATNPNIFNGILGTIGGAIDAVRGSGAHSGEVGPTTIDSGPYSWLPDIYAAVPTKDDLLVHQPFFWKEMLAVADVKIGNWAKASKGFAKVDDRSSLWKGVAEWQAQARLSPQGQSRPTIVFAKCSLCTLLSADRSYVQGPYVVLGTFNDNWGMLSDVVPGKIHFKQSVSMMRDPRCGRSMEDLEAFIADPRLKLWVVNHHVFRRQGLHEKVLSLPLGVQDRGVWAVGKMLAKEVEVETQVKVEIRRQVSLSNNDNGNSNGPTRAKQKQRLLEVNNNEWRFRSDLNAAVNQSFGFTLVNSYATSYKDKNSTQTQAQRRQVQAAYLRRLSESDFVLCPPGLGMDSYRVYEVLAMGSVPVLERSPGLDRALANLPVLFVDDLASDLTPDLLRHVKEQWLIPSPPSAHKSPAGSEGRFGAGFLKFVGGGGGGSSGRVDDGGDSGSNNGSGGDSTGSSDGGGSGGEKAYARRGRSPPKWEFARLTGKFWTDRVLKAAVSGAVPDQWGGAQEAVGGGCRCWFPAGCCVDLALCQGSKK